MKRILLSMGLLLCGVDFFASVPTPGTLDTNFNVAGANPGYMNLSTELTSPFSTPNIVKTMLQLADGGYFIATYDDEHNYITKLDADSLQDTTFAASTDNILTITGAEKIAAMMIDQAGYLVVVGEFGFIQQYNATTGVATSWHATMNLDKGWGIAQQSNGRYIVAGKRSGTGALIAYNSVTGAVDTTFGVNGLYQRSDHSQPLNGVIINAHDEIYYVFTNTGTGYMNLVKLSSDGSSVLWTQSGYNAVVSNYNHLAFDTDYNVIILGLRADHPLETIKFSPDGVYITNGSFGSFNSITSMVVDADNNVLLAGYSGTNPYIVRVLPVLLGPDESFGDGGFVTLTIPDADPNQSTWNAMMINAAGDITVGGYGAIASVDTPYLMRIYGTADDGQYLPAVAAGTPGNLNTNFGVDGKVDLTALLAELSDTLYVGAVPVAVLPMENGSRYVAFNNQSQATSFVARFTNANVLDTTYGTDGISASCLPGVNAMIMDGNGCLVLIGFNDYVGSCWITRYKAGNTGDLDPTFGTDDMEGTSIIGAPGDASIVTSVIQQSLGRYIVSGKDWPSFKATLWAFTTTGAIDTTFNSNSLTPGMYQMDIIYIFNKVVADSYDRLYVTARNAFSGQVYALRLTSFGELDLTFNADDLPGMATVLNNCDDELQIFMTFDAAGNIVVAAHTLRTVSDVTSPYISIAAVDTTGVIVESQLNIAFAYAPTLTNLIATADGKLLLAGYQSENNAMWVARVQDNGDGAYELDTTFNPSGSTYGTIRGVMQFSFGVEDITSRNLSSIAIYGDGTISMVGHEMSDGPVTDSFLSCAYDTPYTTQEIVCQNSKPIGTNDLTLGILTPPADGFLFFATPEEDLPLVQSAQAVALQDDATIIVAIDGQATEDGPSQIFINAFEVDGLPDTNFSSDGQAVVLTEFDNQYVRDMMTFTTTDGVHKAILAGYATNTVLGSNNSLLMQYDLEIAALDTSFGGYNGDLPGLAVGNGSSQGFTVGRQSIGRIILGGFNPGNSLGLLQGYTMSGLLDQSFGAGGYFTQGSTGIYTSLIDHKDRIVIAYNDGSNNLILARILSDGSGLDLTFGEEGTGIFFLDYYGTLASNNSFRIVLDQDGTIYIAAFIVDEEDISAIAMYGFNPETLDSKSSSFGASSFGDHLSNFVFGKLLINNDGCIVVSGSDEYSNLITQMVIDESGFIRQDADFNAEDTPGYLRYNITEIRTPSRQFLTSGLIHPDGRYIFVGNNPSGPV